MSIGSNATLPFEAYNGDKPYIFVCYSHRNIILVYNEIKRICDSGYRIWYDEGIAPSSEWPEEIAKALQNAAFFIVFISNSSIASANVRNEINFALNKGKKILAIYLEETVLPPGLELRMGDIQSINKWQLNKEHYNRKIISVLPKELIETQNDTEIDITTSNGVKTKNESIKVSLKPERSLTILETNAKKVSRKAYYFAGSVIIILIFAALYYLLIYKSSFNTLDRESIRMTSEKGLLEKKDEELKMKELNKSQNKLTNGKYPQTSIRLVSSQELTGMSKYDLKIMRNEIFARHGYIFKTDDMQNYFNSQNWYTPLYDDVTSMLSSIEITNGNFIKSFEN